MTRDEILSGTVVSNEIVWDDPDHARVVMLCGCGCRERGYVPYSTDDSGGMKWPLGRIALVLRGHGDPARAPGGIEFHLCSIPQVLYSAMPEAAIEERVVAARLASFCRGPRAEA